MSAVNVLVTPHWAVLLTDTKATNEAGIQYNAVKYATFPWARMAIAVRGYIGALRVFERLIGQNANTYDRAVQFVTENFDGIRKAVYADASEAYAMKQDVDLYIVGWGINGPAAAWVSNYQTGGQVQRIMGCHISPMVDLDAQTRFAPDVKAGMTRLMADQAAQHVAVGGWINILEVKEDGLYSYAGGGLDALSAVASRIQPQEEQEQLAAVKSTNAELAAASAAA